MSVTGSVPMESSEKNYQYQT